MFFIRHNRLFDRKGLEKPTILSNKRSEGRLKRYESCTDTRAWSLDRRERANYILDFMTSIARAENTQNRELALQGTVSKRQIKERALKGTSSQTQSREVALEEPFTKRQIREVALEEPFTQRQIREVALEEPFTQRQVSPSGYEKEYVSEAIEHVGVLHSETDAVDLQSGNLPFEHIRQESEEDVLDDIPESSLNGGKFTQAADLQPNPHGGYGHSIRKELSTSSKETTFNGEHSGVALRHVVIKAERKSAENAVQSKNLFEDETIRGEDETMRGEDETLSLGHIKQESLEESIPNDISESSRWGGKSAHIASCRPNPHKYNAYSPEEEFTLNSEHAFLGHANIKHKKKSDDAVQSNNMFEDEKIGGEDETMRGEDETLPLDHFMQESVVESILNDISENSLPGGKFAQIAALQPNPDEAVQLDNLFGDETIIGKDKTLSLGHIKQESLEESILNDISKSSLCGGKFARIAACRPNPHKYNGYSPEEEFTLNSEHALLGHADIKLEKKSDDAVQSNNLFEVETIRGEVETLPLDHIKQESLEESLLNDNSESSHHGGKLTRIAAQRPNPTHNCVCSAAKELLTSSKVSNFYTLSLQPANTKHEKKSDESLPSTKGKTFYTVSLQPAYIKVEKKSDESFHADNLSTKKSGVEDESNIPLNHVTQESIAESILDDVFRSSLHGEKFTQIAALKPNPELMTMAREYVSDVARESTYLKKEDIVRYYEHVMPKEKETHSKQVTSSEGFKKHEEEVLDLKAERGPYREQMDLKSATCSCQVVKEDSFVPEAQMEYRYFVRGSPSSSSKYSLQKEESRDSQGNPSVLYVSYSRAPTITISEAETSAQDKKVSKNFHGEQRDPQTAACPCNTTKKPDHMLKTEKLPVNVQAPEVNKNESIVREMKGYNNSNIDSSRYIENDISFDSDSDICKQRVHACGEAKQVSFASKEATEIPDGGMAYYLIPVPQAQRSEFSFSDKGVKSSDSAKQAGHVAKQDGLAVDVPAFGTMVVASSEIKKEEVSLPYVEVNGTDGSNMYILMDAGQFSEEGVPYGTESSVNKQYMCACNEAKETDSVSQEETELPACGRVYFLYPVSQVQGTEYNDPGKEGEIYGDKVSSEPPITDVIHFNEHMESQDSSNMNSSQYAEDDISFDSESDCCKLRFHACREAPHADVTNFDELDESHRTSGSIHTEMSEKLVRSFDVERNFYKEQMDTALRKLNDQIKEIENLRAERDSLKTNLGTAQNYIEQHKQAINKLNNMRKVDEQLSRENELLLKKIYQLSHTAFNQQTKISKLKTKLKQKAKHSSYIQNCSCSGKCSGDVQPVQIMYPTSKNNLRMPYKSVFVESYSQYPIKNSASDAASRYSNMTGNDRYSYNHINAKGAFVERTYNHVHITSITDHTPQTKKYLDLKKTIRREKDDLLKVTKLIQFQQGVISNLSNCIDNERMLLSELNSATMGKKREA